MVPKEEFLGKYLAEGRPVLMTEIAKGWPLNNMGFAELGELLAPYQGFIKLGEHDLESETDTRTVVGMPLDRYMAMLDSYTEESPPYLKNNPFPDSLHELIEFPPYFARTEYAPPRIWVGPANSLTKLHRDTTDNFFTQVAGTKRVILVSPDQGEFIYCTTSSDRGVDWVPVDPEKPDFARYPLLEKAVILSTNVEPGEMLFIPEGWFHHVRSLTKSISLNVWTVSSRRM